MNRLLHQTRFLNPNYLFYYLLLVIVYSCDAPKNNSSHYSVNAIVNTEQQSVNVTVDISYLPSASTSRLEFIAHENITIQSCSADGLLNYTEKEANNKAKTIVLHFENEVEKLVTIRFEYTFVLKEGDAPWGIDKIAEGWIELSLNSGWLPIISSFDNQFSAEAELQIVSEQTFNVLSSGITEVIGDNTFKITNETPQIDLVLIGSSKFKQRQKDHITIFENEENKERNEFIFNFGEKSYQWLNTAFGGVKKLPPVKLVITPRSESGYARKNFIVLSNDISAKDTLHFVNYITHEFAHFWSTGANPLSEHRWLDESIAEYLAWKYISKNRNETKWNEFIARAKKEADTIPPVYVLGEHKVPSHAVMYRKGVYRLFQLEQMIGEEKMFSLLSDWFTVAEKDSEKFLAKLENSAGAQTADRFRVALSK